MSFLAPMFLIGAAGIAIPIVLHLIRRQTKAQQDFSSLMFLEPSPPRMMQRSRIDQWFLLLLRGLALLLLVGAFARPYWNSSSLNETSAPELRRAILLDTSASMKRDGVWDKAIESIRTVASTLQSNESLALYTFDQHINVLVSHEDSNASPPSERVQKVLAALSACQPSSRGTDLGLALATVGDQLTRTDEKDDANSDSPSEIVLVSDFQAGCLIDRLENYQWPTQCRLRILRVEPKNASNVCASILNSKDEHEASSAQPQASVLPTPAPTTTSTKEAEKTHRDKLAVRLNNYGDDVANVTLNWLDPNGRPIEAGTEVAAEVPANGSTVVRIEKLDVEAVRLRLEGDASIFDNDRFVAKPPKRSFDVVCIDREQREPTESLGYFLKQLPLGDESRDVHFVWREPGSTADWPVKELTPLIVASHDLVESDAIQWKAFIEQGGHGLWVFDHSLEDGKQLAAVQSQWQALTSDPPPEIREAKAGHDAMFESIDFTHPLFRSLSDSKFNDFTKIRFWKHRNVELNDSWTTIAKYDDSFPAIAFRQIGNGTLWWMSSGWQPQESQFALSSKFVPILSAIFSMAAPVERVLDSVMTGDKIECEEGERWANETGLELELEVGQDRKQFLPVEEPGFLRVQRDDQRRFVAVNLPLSESNTQAMEVERLERLGVITSDSSSTRLASEKKEQLHSQELEGQQRAWRWLIIGMLGAIVVETIWSLRGQQSK
jgi:Aerotolerance regulator N-terminal/von Willebrand factor type A domain